MLAVIGSIFFLTLLIGAPIAICLGLAGAVYAVFWLGLPPSLLVRRMYYVLDSFPLLAVPLFIMLGHLSERAGLIPRLIEWLQLLIGWMRGGMAYVNVIATMIFSGISGTAVADVASLGRIMITMMRKTGYDHAFSCALTAANSIMGPIIPPSVAFIIYALAVGNVSIAAMFLAGAIPGIVMGLSLLAYSWYRTRGTPVAPDVRMPRPRQVVVSTFGVLPILVLPFIILAGVVGGLVTVTESAAIGVAYVVFYGFAVSRELKLRDIYDSLVYAATTSSILGMLMGAGAIVAWLMTRNQATAQLTAFVVSISSDPIVYMLIVFVVLTIIGCVMDATAVIIALAPLMAPVAMQLGIPDVQFGLVFCMTVLVGMITPPVGLVLFLTCSIGNITFNRLARAIIPFCLIESVVILAAIMIPGVTLWLPHAFGFR
jgi:tripartite ATP-independent transporter DctM subunit